MSTLFADLLTSSLRPSTDSASDSEDLSSLPFPLPLSRPTFSTPDFNTETFLLQHAQFRTLDDLHGELRAWVDRLEGEMETLIEEDWMGYLSLGRRLEGGEVGVKEAEKRIRAVERDIQVHSRPRSHDGSL
jgi:conserved oligomeric Golgi complex subunit 2